MNALTNLLGRFPPGLRIAVWLALAVLALVSWADVCHAQGMPALVGKPGPGGSQNWSLSVQTLVLLTSLSFLPALLLSMTSFTRILIVLSLLRTAIGTQSTPPNQVLVGMSLFLTFFVMSPVFDKAYETAYKPFSEDRISADKALERGVQPFKEFMLKQTREADLALHFFRNPGRLLTRDHLIQVVWSLTPMIDTRTVDVHVSTLRRKLGLTPEFGWRLVSIYGLGYRLERQKDSQ